MKPTPSFPVVLLNSRWLLPGAVAGALGAGWLAGQVGMVVPGLLMLGPLAAFFLILVFNYPRAGYLSALAYGFLLTYFTRHLADVPMGLAMEAILGVTWLAVLFHRSDPPDWYRMHNDLCRITGHRHDPCVLDTLLAAVRYREGAPKWPWWKYTAERKRELAARRETGH